MHLFYINILISNVFYMSVRECVLKDMIPKVSPISNPDGVPDNHQTVVSQAFVFFRKDPILREYRSQWLSAEASHKYL